jgi:glycosyltransferase involved in cell wall biosynthesis
VALLAALLREGFPSRLLLLGDGPDRAAVEAEVARRGLQARVALLGDQADCARWFAAAELFLLPSAEESFGLAAAEAMACGTPVLASAVGGLPEVVEHGRSGWLLPVGDVEAACAAALGLLRDRRRLAEAGRQARRRAELLFRRRPAVTAYEALYRRVLAARAGPGHGAA